MKREPESFVAQVCFLLECAGIVHPPGTKGETGWGQYTYPFLIVEDTPQEVRLWVTLLTDEPRLPSWSYIQQVLGTHDMSSELVRGPSEWGDSLSIQKPGKEQTHECGTFVGRLEAASLQERRSARSYHARQLSTQSRAYLAVQRRERQRRHRRRL